MGAPPDPVTAQLTAVNWEASVGAGHTAAVAVLLYEDGDEESVAVQWIFEAL